MAEPKGQQPQDLDLDKQLDALLSRLRQADPGLAREVERDEPVPVSDDSAPTEPESQTADRDAQAEADAALANASFQSAEDLIGEDLADQIQELLDNSRNDEAVAQAAKESPGTMQDVDATEAPDTTEPDDQTPDGAFASLEDLLSPPEAPPEVKAATPPEASSSSEAAAAPEAKTPPQAKAAAEAAAEAVRVDDNTDHDIVRQIDALLAGEADEAVAGDFETVSDVLGQADESAGPSASSEPAGAHVGAAAVDDDSDIPEGNFASIDDLLNAYDSDSAAAVSAELAEDEARGRSPSAAPAAVSDVAAAAKTDTIDTAAPSRGAALRRRLMAIVQHELKPAQLKRTGRVIERKAHRVCTALNWPLLKVSPEVRDTVGYVGLVTLFVASTLMLGKIAGIL